jgi:hypothetical protein
MLQQRSHFCQHARTIRNVSAPGLVGLFFSHPRILIECIRHQLLKCGEEVCVVRHHAGCWVNPGGVKNPLQKMALKQCLKLLHKPISQVLPISKGLMVPKQSSYEIDVLDIRFALAGQHVGSVG